ncbi:MAG: 40S ribosomal protein S9 [Marteilia pararefringens]
MTGCNTIIRQTKRSISLREAHNRKNQSEHLALCAKYALKSKTELLTFFKMMKDVKIKAVQLGKLPENDSTRLIEQTALFSKLEKYGIIKVVEGSKISLDSVLSLDINNFLERRLGSVVWRTNLATNAHQARVMCNHGHISVNGMLTKVPNMLVKSDSTVEIYRKSRLATKKMGRSAKKTSKKRAEKAADA